MSTPTFVLSQSEATLRSAARGDRARVLAALEAAGSVTIDVSAVERMSDAYADELFGVLSQHFGASWVLEHLDIVGADDGILRSVAQAIAQGARLRRARAGSTRRPASRISTAVRH